MTQPAYLYARYSTMDQHKGDSLPRQIRDGQAYIEYKGWEFSEDRVLIDKGRSAYHGKNRIEGSALGEFERKTLEGHFNNGAVLVVESIDRLTRQGFDQLYDLIRMFIANGVSVAITQDGELFESGKKLDMAQVLRSVIRSELANEESSKKSKRLKASWQSKIQAVQDGSRIAMTKVIPGWLQTDPVTRVMSPIPHRAKILDQIYDWCLEGVGLPKMVARLNEAGEITWGRGKHANAKGWNVGTLHKYLTSRTVLGEYEPKMRVGDDLKTPKGFVIPDYYPQVISPEKFNKVQAIRKGREKWGGKTATTFPNLFSNIATCSECGGRIHMTAQNKAGGTRKWQRDGKTRVYVNTTTRSYLRCQLNVRKYQCENKTSYRYELLEKGVLDTLFELALNKTAFKPSDAVAAVTSRIAEQERLIEVKQRQLETITENLMAVYSKTLAQKASEIEQSLEDDEAALVLLHRELATVQGSSKPEEAMYDVLEARAEMTSEDLEVRYAARVKTHTALKTLISQMACNPDGTTEIVIGNSALLIGFSRDGECLGIDIGVGAIIQGPNGEPNWHPDEEAAE